MTTGDILSLQIDKPAAGGRMIGRFDGQVVLVRGGIPGERVKARIERLGKGVAYAETLDVEAASPDRREPPGDPACGGCLYAHIAYPRQLAIKAAVVADALARIGRIRWAAPIAVAASDERGYRMRARLHLRESRIGFFREGTHDICNARSSGQLLPETTDALDGLAVALARLQPGVHAEVELSENIPASERAIHVHTDRTLEAAAVAATVDRSGVTGLTIDGLTGAPIVASGDPYVTDVLTAAGQSWRMRRHVLAFFQGNRFLLPALVGHVVAMAGAQGDVLDLYAGVGLFAVALAAVHGARVTAVEGDRWSAADLRTNAAPFGDAIRTLHEPVETFTARRPRPPAVVIVDPPRTGMSKASLMGALGLAALRVVYVSCDVATLARDARSFVDAGYQVDRIDAFDLFPNTPHVETVVVFRRGRS